MTEFAGSTQNQKKVCLVPQKWKGAKNSFEGHSTEFASSTKNPTKIIETSNQPIRTKIFPSLVP
jgi:hypothetical protein